MQNDNHSSVATAIPGNVAARAALVNTDSVSRLFQGFNAMELSAIEPTILGYSCQHTLFRRPKYVILASLTGKSRNPIVYSIHKNKAFLDDRTLVYESVNSADILDVWECFAE